MILRSTQLFSQLLLEYLPRPKRKAESGPQARRRESHVRFSVLDATRRHALLPSGPRNSLRVLCSGLAYCLGKLVHLSSDSAPDKSTLSYVNAHRPAALLAMLLLRWLHRLSRAAWSFAGMAAMVRLNLFTYRDLLEWLHKPYGDPPAPPDRYAGLQLELHFPGFGQPN